MLTEKKKIAHLLGELIPYALESEPQRVTITIEDLVEKIQITVEDTGTKRDAAECLDVEYLFSAGGHNGFKDYYSGLAGKEPLGLCNLRIVGMMVDGGHVERNETGTKLTVWWERE